MDFFQQIDNIALLEPAAHFELFRSILRHISDRRGTVKAAHTSARQAAEKAILCSSSQECL